MYKTLVIKEVNFDTNHDEIGVKIMATTPIGEPTINREIGDIYYFMDKFSFEIVSIKIMKGIVYYTLVEKESFINESFYQYVMSEYKFFTDLINKYITDEV